MSGSPSAWEKRLPIAGLALAGLAIAVYLTLYQLGIVPIVWEPFFGDGSRRVLHSPISRLLPVPDASLGAVGYLVEIVTGLTPKTVLFFGAVVAAMALFGLLLAAIQAFWLRAGCTLCLTSAAISVGIAAMARKEILAVARRASS
ncbi:MAG TPA: vitamin K epoxide reductase family protein [Thermoanaerobaculia bacterium]|nr:vitamin K epoxide reductase family protein [Thermoanaerobaculia bacterium]